MAWCCCATFGIVGVQTSRELDTRFCLVVRGIGGCQWCCVLGSVGEFELSSLPCCQPAGYALRLNIFVRCSPAYGLLVAHSAVSLTRKHNIVISSQSAQHVSRRARFPTHFFVQASTISNRSYDDQHCDSPLHIRTNNRRSDAPRKCSADTAPASALESAPAPSLDDGSRRRHLRLGYPDPHLIPLMTIICSSVAPP